MEHTIGVAIVIVTIISGILCIYIGVDGYLSNKKVSKGITDSETRRLYNRLNDQYPHPRGPISVYIASPYSLGSHADNVRAQIECAATLRSLGFFPFCPLLSYYEDVLFPADYETWMKADMYWLSKSDCLLRLPGNSHGADRETTYAFQHGIPVFYSIEDIPH